MLSPPLAGPLLIAGFVRTTGKISQLGASAHLPAWYLPLRFRLTAVACLALAAGSFAYYG